MSAFLLNGKIVHYENLGRGRPVIFLHGWVGSWRYWIASMQAASIGYRAYALDFWGYGESTRADDQYSLTGQTDLLNGFLGQMGMGRVALIGHGFGGVVALNFAARFPDFVDRVMTIGFPFSVSALNPKMKWAVSTELIDLVVPKEPLYESARSDAAKADMSALKTCLNELDNELLSGLYNQGDRVSLYVHGLQDTLVAPPQEDQLDRLPAQSHMIHFDGSGHFPMLDQPNRFHRLLIDFLTLESGESPRDLQLKDEWKRRVR
jgi:pimeloyl-ACP methyl ester carboxylesterase